MKIKSFIIKLLVLISSSITLSADSDLNIKIFTEHYPPLNMKVAGQLTGSSVEILSEIFKKIGSKQRVEDIKVTNWSRAYTIALKLPNSMVFSTTRTSQRENKFKWVGPIASSTIGILALKENHIVLNNFSDINRYTIGAVLKDVSEEILLSKGVHSSSIQHVAGKDAINISFKKMEKGRIDMFIYNTEIALKDAKKNGFDIDKYEIIYKLSSKKLYYAFNKKTDDKIIQKWQKALDDIKLDGTYSKIVNKYR